MSVATMVVALLGVVASVISFMFGKIFSQSENILDRKREAYGAFLRFCPAPNEAHSNNEMDATQFQREIGILTVYASPEVLKNSSSYFSSFAEAQEQLSGIQTAGHPAFIRVMTEYNRMVWAMRTDAMAWSIFAPNKKGREYRPSLNPKDFQ